MSVLTRIESVYRRFPKAIQLLRTGTLTAPRWAIEEKSLPTLWPQAINNKPERQMIDYRAYAKHGYSRNALMYAAITYKARAISLAPLRAYTGDEDNPDPLPKEHPLSLLARRPNRYESMMEFMQKNVIYDNIAGNIFIYKDRTQRLSGLPDQLISLRPDRVHIVPQADSTVGFVYDPRDDGRNVFPIMADDMIHIKRPNPNDPLEGMGYGMSPMAAAAEVGDIDNMITQFLNLFWKTGMSPMVAITFDVPLDPEDVAMYRQQIMEIYGRGAEGWVKPFIIDKSGKITPLTPSFKDLDFVNLDARDETRILGVFGVPGMLIGALSGLQRATFCLPATARVSTPNGLMTMGNLRPGMIIWSNVDGHIRPRMITHWQKTGTKQIYVLRTRNRMLRASGNHPVLTRVPGKMTGRNADKHSTLEWRKLEDIRPGDYVVQPQYLPEQGEDKLPDGSIATIEMMKLFGCILGDGTVDTVRGKLRMSIPEDSRVYSDYRSLVERLVFKNNGDQAHINLSTRSFNASAANQMRTFEQYGLGGRAHTKRIPGWIYRLTRDLRLGVLAGLVDSDGYIDARGALTFGMCNEDLVCDIRELLLSAGIQTSNVRATVVAESALPNPGKMRSYAAYYITASAAADIAAIPFSDALYRERVEANNDRLRRAGKHHRNPWLSPDFGFYRVREVLTENIEDVYDIEVEGGHSFIADGIVVHNSNFQQATETFWQDTMWPELMIIEVDLRDNLRTDDGGFVAFDSSRVPSLQKNLPELIASFRDLFVSGVPRDIAAQVVGLTIPPTVDGMVGYIPVNMMPVSNNMPVSPKPAGEPSDTNMPLEQAPSGDQEAGQPDTNRLMAVVAIDRKAIRERRIKKLERITSDQRQDYIDATERAFEKDRREVLALIIEGEKSAYRKKETVQWKTIIRSVDEFFDSISWLNWQEEFAPVLTQTLDAAGLMWAEELGTTFNLSNVEAEAWFADYKLKFAQDNIVPTTREGVHQVLAQAEFEGWSIPQTSDRTRLLFDQWISGGVNPEDFEWMTERLPIHRTELIARTELTRMANAGSFNLFKAWDVSNKEWLTAGDSDVRESHQAMNHQTKLIDEPFISGTDNKLMYPGDPSAPIEETANCRCAILPGE